MKSLLEALSRVIGRHPGTTFVCVHFGNNSEELDWVDDELDQHPNMMVDLAARIPEIGRHDPKKCMTSLSSIRTAFFRHRFPIAGPADDPGFQRHRSAALGGGRGGLFPQGIPLAGNMGQELAAHDAHPGQLDHQFHRPAASVLRKIYFDNARQFLARSLPAPVLQARRTARDFEPDGDLTKTLWQTATPVHVEAIPATAKFAPSFPPPSVPLVVELFVYCLQLPFHRIDRLRSTATEHKRFDLANDGVSLWDRDVVEAFVGADANNIKHYTEFEVAPSNERLDVSVNLPDKDFAWESDFQSAVKVDQRQRFGIAKSEFRWPPSGRGASRRRDAKWRLNLYRGDRSNNVGLAWNPCLKPSFHTPERFGVLELVE